MIILLIINKFLFRETQEAKQELEKGREDLAQMMERLRADQAMEAEEKARLEEEINAKAEEVAEIQNAVKSNFLPFLPKLLLFFLIKVYAKQSCQIVLLSYKTGSENLSTDVIFCFDFHFCRAGFMTFLTLNRRWAPLMIQITSRCYFLVFPECFHFIFSTKILNIFLGSK